MTMVGNIKRCFIALYYIDFRKGPHGLLSEAKKNNLEPYLGDLLIFISKDRKKIKGVIGSDTGLVMIYKIFSLGVLKTRFKFLNSSEVTSVTYAELCMLIEGSSYTIHSSAKKWLPKNLQ